MTNTGRVYSNMLASLNEAHILDEEKQRRLIDASYSDALKILADYGWGDGGETDIDAVISKETAKLIEFVSENCASRTVKAVLLSQFLFNNAKAAYKNKVTGKSDSLGFYGGLPDLAGIAENNYSDLEGELAAALTSLDAMREERELPPQEIDRAVSGAMYSYLVRITKFNPRLKRYIISEIDMLNLMTLLRCRRLGFDVSTLTLNLIPGGKIPHEDFTNALGEADDAFNMLYQDSDYGEVFGEALTEAFADIEVRMDNYLYALTLAGKANITSDAPFINYFYKQLYEYKTVKMILICIKNGVSGEIKRRLRDIYE